MKATTRWWWIRSGSTDERGWIMLDTQPAISSTWWNDSVERFSRPNASSLHYEATIEDAKNYTKPWTTRFNVK
jgi:hypothetical protein